MESFAFNSIESAFRLASDNTLRSLLVTKPYWHDYIASLHQFNMRRWNDGDDFLVNYVGHPMQGGIATYLEIQNSPTQAQLQWGDNGYWNSRFKGFLWSTVYSTYSEIGPTGEAAIGNEGGYTYDTHCVLHCNTTTALPSGRITNNTGWVDFIITPTVGMLWVFAEDFLDKDVNERIMHHARPNAVYPKIIRGALNPTRTFANLLRGRKPWYRDWDYPEIQRLNEGYGMHFVNAWEAANGELEAYPDWKRIEIAPHSYSFATTITTQHCQYCVHMTQGYGVQVSTQLWKYFYADTDLSYQPSASLEPSDRAGGSLLAGYFGVRVGKHWPLYAVNLSIRPGFLQWQNAYLTSIPLSTPTQPAPPNPPAPQLGTITHFAWNFMLAGDYKFNQHIALRAGIQESIVRYRNACLDSSGIGISDGLQWLNYQTPCQVSAGVGKPPYLSFPRGFRQPRKPGIQFGPVFSF